MAFDPYQEWLQISTSARSLNHYELLGVPVFECDIELIKNQALARTAHVRRYQLGEHSEEALRLLGELSAAFDTLTTPDRKRSYDESLSSQQLPGLGQSAAASTPQRTSQPLTATKRLTPRIVSRSPEPVAAGPVAGPTPEELSFLRINRRADRRTQSQWRRGVRRTSRSWILIAGAVLALCAGIVYVRPWEEPTVRATANPSVATRSFKPSDSSKIMSAEQVTQQSDTPPTPLTPSTPKWVPVFLTDEDLSGDAIQKRVLGARLTNGTIEMRSGALSSTRLWARDAVIRTRATKLPGQNIGVQLRRTQSGYYGAWFNGGRWFGVGKPVNGRWVDLKHAHARRSYDREFEFKFSAVGNRLIVWADDELILEATDDDYRAGAPGISVSNGWGRFRDVEFQSLDAAPARP